MIRTEDLYQSTWQVFPLLGRTTNTLVSTCLFSFLRKTKFILEIQPSFFSHRSKQEPSIRLGRHFIPHLTRFWDLSQGAASLTLESYLKPFHSRHYVKG